MKLLTIATALLMTIAGGTAMVQAQTCSITGDMVATPTMEMGLPSWTYTLTVHWDTGNAHALSHLNLLIDPVGGTCGCMDVASALTIVNPAGESDGEGGCTVSYDAFLECNGDPSIPGVDGILVKFEPIMGECEPGVMGTGTFVFYSELAPVPVDEDILSLVDKFSGEFCFGNLTGDFPGLVCNPVANEAATWGTVKGLFK